MSTDPLVLGTAGHVDHGKTALVLALTGRDTDRLPEEKARGISIALGFAPLALDAGRTVSLVDVPGHERFVRHMVAGASGIDGYLLCVAADDGVMPQTTEHMAVLELLGVADGVVAVTKADLMDPEPAIDEVRELVGDGPEVVAVSAVDGRGIGDLRAALGRLADRLPRRTADGPSRLFVDRVFSVAGAGTVVTGTLWGAPIATDDRVRIVPGDRVVRVRSVQSHDVAVESASGGRVALNLAGLARDAISRGDCVVRADEHWAPTGLLDVRLSWLGANPKSLRSRRRLQVFLGTAEVGATCVLLEGDELVPGGSAFAQLRLDASIPALPGDRLVLRSAERQTVGGGLVLDAAPERRGKGSAATAWLEALERGDADEIRRHQISRAGPRGVDAAGWTDDQLAAAGAMRIGPGSAVVEPLGRAAIAAISAELDERGSMNRGQLSLLLGLESSVAAALIDALIDDGTLVADGDRVRLAGVGEADDPLVCDVLEALVTGGLQPPGPDGLVDRLGVPPAAVGAALGLLRDRGLVVNGGELWFAADVARTAVEQARALLVEGPRGIGELRDLWGVGRKHALALAAYLDAAGITRRVGDQRVLRRGAAAQ